MLCVSGLIHLVSGEEEEAAEEEVEEEEETEEQEIYDSMSDRAPSRRQRRTEYDADAQVITWPCYNTSQCHAYYIVSCLPH